MIEKERIMNYIGVDGCKNGWFYLSLDDYENWETGVIPNVHHLIETNEKCLILVDIPIGLRHKGNLERLCDKEARKVLGNRRSSVFPTPCRAAVYESDYEKASRRNHEMTGRYLSKQSRAISNKIRQVDELLTSSITSRKLIREVHPEICFWGLNGRESMKYNKKTPEGFNERLEVIRRVYMGCDELVDEVLLKYKRREVTKDDVLDALVGAVTARFGFNTLKTLPEAPEYDEMGLSMEMVYCLPNEPTK
ncbi:MAG: DUF429 domain-containing protein [Candidatus Methanoperedens sp.]|nr:DUF429 domain-containing protein [Candidatus Methanoperedens sp.]